MIPGLILPAYNRHDLLQRLIESIDYPVSRALVINNGPEDCLLDYSKFGPLSPRIFKPPYTSLGYGGSINFGLTQMADAPWVMWASNDIVFERGMLEHVTGLMARHRDPRVITGGFTWGAINRAAIREVGLVDEWSFFPIYFDDNDYHYRCVLAGVEWMEISTGWKHGDELHPGSATILSDPKIREANHLSFKENERRYIEKWGGPPGAERYTTPWNRGFPIWTVTPDLEGRAARQW